MRFGKHEDEAMWAMGLLLSGYRVLVDNAMPDRVIAVNDKERWVKMNQAQLDRINLVLSGEWTDG